MQPKLLRRKKGELVVGFFVELPITDGWTQLIKGRTPSEAISAARAEVSPQHWCRLCVGTGVDGRWNGQGSKKICEACNGTGAPDPSERRPL